MTLGHPPNASLMTPAKMKWPLVLRNERSLVQQFQILRGWKSTGGRSGIILGFCTLSVIHPQLKSSVQLNNVEMQYLFNKVMKSQVQEEILLFLEHSLTSASIQLFHQFLNLPNNIPVGVPFRMCTLSRNFLTC